MKNRRKIVSIVAFVLVLIMTFGLISGALAMSVHAASSAEIQQQINDLQAEAGSIAQQKEDLQAQIDAIRMQL